MQLLDVEVIATVLEFTANPLAARRAISLLHFRLVSKRWKSAAATALQRKLEATNPQNCGAQEKISATAGEEPLHPKPLWEGLSWNCSSKSEFRAVYVSAADFCQTFFEALAGVTIRNCMDWELKWILSVCPNLGKLEVEATEVNEPSLEVLKSIGEKCPKLKMIGSGYSCRLVDNEVDAILSQVTQLEILQLLQAQSCTDNIFSTVSNHHYQLTWLNITGFPLKRQSSLIAFLETQGTLEHLDLSSIGRLGDRTLECIGRCCPNLTNLDVSWCPRVSSQGMLDVTSRCAKLKRLKALGVKELGEETLKRLPTNCPELIMLSLYRDTLTSDAVEGIGNCKGLRSLDIHRTRTVEGARLWRVLSGLSKLQHLSLTDMEVTDHELVQLAEGCGATLATFCFRDLTGFSETALVTFVQRCSKLTSIAIKKEVLGDTFLNALENLPHLELQVLDLSSQKRMTSDGLQAFLRSPSARKLRSLSCDGVPAVNDSVLRCLADAECGNCIKHLSVGHTSVTDKGLMYLMGKCICLNILDISPHRYRTVTNSGRVTDTFVDFLIQRMPETSLGYVTLYGCKAVSASSLRRLMKTYPDLSIGSDYTNAELNVRRKGSRPDPPPSHRDGESGSDEDNAPTPPRATAPKAPRAPIAGASMPPPAKKKEKSCALM